MKTRAIALCVLLLTIVALTLVTAPTVAAATVTFTSTADFDAGTKSNPGDGNYDVETNTDNLGIAAGAFELSSLKGDSFTLADADADTFKWDLPANFGTPTVNQREITAGVLSIDITGTAYRVAGVVLASSVSGTVDARVKADETLAGTSYWPWLGMSNEKVSDCQASATVDGVWFRRFGPGTFQTWGCINGALTQVGTTTISAIDPAWLRISGSSGAWTTYFSSDGTAWTQDETPTTAIAGSLYVTISTGVNGATSAGFDYDDFHLATGTVDAGGFRTTGNWRSATQTYTGAALTTVDITYSGASANGYVDDVAILSSADAVLWNDGTDRTSGTSASYTVSPSVTQDWKVRITLAGSNAATATMESVVVTTNENPTAVVTSDREEPCIGESVSFSSASSTDSDGTITVWSWDFGDGATSTLANPDHAFPFNGQFTVSLTVTDNAGGTGATTFAVFVSDCQLPGRVLVIDVACSYNSFVRVWSCTDRTDYTGWEPAVFDRMVYQYDGSEVAVAIPRNPRPATLHGTTVHFEAGESVLDSDGDHLLIVTWHLSNGGTPSATYVLHVDNRPVQVVFVLVGVGLLFLLVAALIRRRGGAIAYEPVQNPAYRRWPSEEFPKGWRTHRRVPHRPDLPTRSERRGNLWVIYQVRPATAAEQQRTGRKRVAYVQAVREKM